VVTGAGMECIGGSKGRCVKAEGVAQIRS